MHSSITICVLDKAISLIVQIISQLVRHKGSGLLQLQLRSLQQTLIKIRLVIQEYERGPLGQSLANMITSEVGRCCVQLRELLESVNNAGTTWIGDFRGTVLWKRWDGEELVSLSKKLSHGQQLFEGYLWALHSYVLLFHKPPSAEPPYETQSGAWIELSNEFRAGPVSLRRLRDLFNQRLFLGHVRLNAIEVVSHLGDIIPVPTIFCSTWKVLYICSISLDLHIPAS